MAKPRTAAGYDATQAQHVKATCLYVATKLGDLVDEVVLMGGSSPRSSSTRTTQRPSTRAPSISALASP